MAMKSPTQTTTQLNVNRMLPTVTSLSEATPSTIMGHHHHQAQAQQMPKQTANNNEVEVAATTAATVNFKPQATKININTFQHSLEAQALNVPELLKMVSEPLNEYCKEMTAINDTAPATPAATQHSVEHTQRYGMSRSHDDDVEANEFLLEQNFGSVSPIYQTGRGSGAPQSNSRASNLRLKFRKSHTCGSLFANCNCSSPPAVPIPIHAAPAAQNSAERARSVSRGSSAGGSVGNATAFNFSISPPDTADSTSSASSKLTSGIYSLSTQTSSATSAQLSHDESFDYVACGSSGVVAAAAAGISNAQSTTALASNNLNNSTDNSLNAARQVCTSQSETETNNSKKITTNQQPTNRISLTQSHNSSPSLATSPGLARRSERYSTTKRYFQSYSHPDTDFIFTEANKHPSRESLLQAQQHDSVIKTRGGKVEIKQPKRSSSPNIGQYHVLDVAVHPDILVKISPKHSPIAETRRLNSPLTARSTQQRRRLLQRSHEIESGGSTSESEHSYDIRATGIGNNKQNSADGDLEKVLTHNAQESSAALLQSPTFQPKLDVANKGAEDKSFNAAQKYFAESGILGPINTSSNLIRKTSKILQDSNVIEQIRKTSMILRGNPLNLNGSRKSSTILTPTATIAGGEITKARTPSSSPPPFTLALRYNENPDEFLEPTGTLSYSTFNTTKSPLNMATTCGFSPNMPTQGCSINDDKDAQIKSLQGEIVSLKDVIKSRDAEIVKLRREIHKLKSVLQQTTNPLPITNDELLQSPTSNTNHYILSDHHSLVHEPVCSACKRKFEADSPLSNSMTAGCLTPDSNGSIDSTISENYQSCTTSLSTSNGTTTVTCALAADKTLTAADNVRHDALDANNAATDALTCNGAKTKLVHAAHAPVLKKQGVSGESCETSKQQSINVPIPKYDKDFSSKQLIKDAIMDNDFLKNIDASQVRELVESMYSLSIPKGEFVIREGAVGAHLYVSAEGEFEVVKNGKVLGVMGPGKAFGELAILYNCTRTASIRVLCDARVWVLDRRVFQQIMMRTGMQRIENSVNFLKSVPLLKNLSVEVLAKIADVLEVEFYPAGTYIIRQGASGDTFFLISQGSVKVTQKLSPNLEEKEIRTLVRGDYFGEQALINEDKRTANIIAMAPGVECLTLDRESFTHLIGDLCELKEKNYGDENRVLAMKYAEKTKEIFGANVKQEFPDMKLTDLEVVATLGIGGFGRVELVKAYQENRVDTFALKCLKKRHIVDTKQEEHVFSERTIMLTCNTPFICRLHRTFRDEKYVYMLLEACMGGEIWTMLRDRGCFDENATQFIIGCVLQAFEYLHARGIIYRDLKPENLMLDERGYVKLVDFGFAKYIGNSSKTWTFCGTPEYVAPEIILNKGHDRAVDYWALGILIHELLNGTPPFTANDPMKTYNIILKGIDMIDFPKHMSRSAIQLIKRLCRDVPSERLGYQKGGIQDIKKHKWFLGFDWDGLQSQLLIPPFVRPIAHPTDTTYFDKFPCDPTEPADELSGWDADF